MAHPRRTYNLEMKRFEIGDAIFADAFNAIKFRNMTYVRAWTATPTTPGNGTGAPWWASAAPSAAPSAPPVPRPSLGGTPTATPTTPGDGTGAPRWASAVPSAAPSLPPVPRPSLGGTPTATPTTPGDGTGAQHSAPTTTGGGQSPGSLHKHVLLVVIDDMRRVVISRVNSSVALRTRLVSTKKIRCPNTRPDWGAYGQPASVTPRLDALAAESAVFTHAYAQIANCAPSRTSFLSGHRPDVTRVWNQLTNFRVAAEGATHWKTLPQVACC